MTSNAVQVSCRLRQSNSESLSIEFHSEQHITLQTENGKQFAAAFDHVFPPSTSQVQVYNHIAQPYVMDTLEGYNCTILAYGQSGSGKTYTIFGDSANPGMLPRIVGELYRMRDQRQSEMLQWSITLTMLEVYQEYIQDLLDSQQKQLKIREDKTAGVWVEGATSTQMESPSLCLDAIYNGLKKRSQGSHLLNATSSRGHCILILETKQKQLEKQITISGKLYVVDLAGSETVRKTEASGKLLNEAKHINKSLTALGMVIASLTDPLNKHVPYRNSKLTRLLQNSLGGNAKTHLVLTCSTERCNLEETLSTIRFGQRAKTIQNKAVVNTVRSISEYKILLSAMEHKLNDLSSYIADFENSNTCDACAAKRKQPVFENRNEIAKCCVACSMTEGELFLCDGNCGHYWHAACAHLDAMPENHEWYCSTCAISSDGSIIAGLREAMEKLKQDRALLENKNEIARESYEMSDAKKTSIHQSLETRIEAQNTSIVKLESANQSLTLELDKALQSQNQLRDQEKELQRQLKLQTEMLQDTHSGSTAESTILRRALSSTENQLEQLQQQFKNHKLSQSDEMNLKLSEQKSYYTAILAERDHMIRKLQSSKSEPLPSQDGGDIQEWWQGSSVDSKRPFRSRLSTILSTIQAETSAFEKIHRRHES